jgi:hypothetical protein
VLCPVSLTRRLSLLAAAALLVCLPGAPARAQATDPPCESAAAPQDGEPSVDAQAPSDCAAQVSDGSAEACDPTPGPDGLQHPCDEGQDGATAQPPENPLQPEKNPPGDIPDSQVFVKYTSATNGYEMQVPEGWARTEGDTQVSFADKLDSIGVGITPGDVAPTAQSVSATQAVAIQQTGRAVEIVSVKDVRLPAGPAVLLVYTSNSDPNLVTGKQYRMENTAFLLFKDGKVATLTLSAPSGSDNVDDWRLISRSFRWL